MNAFYCHAVRYDPRQKAFKGKVNVFGLAWLLTFQAESPLAG